MRIIFVMRTTMLLSLKPKMVQILIKYGSKIFEYRRTFPDEEIMAICMSSPMKQIVERSIMRTENDMPHMERKVAKMMVKF